MAGASVRRPIPAVVFILLLSLLSAIVWYRVLNRTPATAQKRPRTPTTYVTQLRARSRDEDDEIQNREAPARPCRWSGRPLRRCSSPFSTARSRAGLAKSVAGQLRARGFKIGTITNDTVDTVTVTQVRYGPTAGHGGQAGAALPTRFAPGAQHEQGGTVTVSLGSSYSRLSTNAAVARAKRTTTPVAC